jgi:putative MATE family efflux protein
MSAPNRSRLTEGPVVKTLIALTLPMIVGIVGMVAFNLVDTFFVGRLGAEELAAMSFTFPVVLIISSLARGLGVGTSAVLSRAIGQGDRGLVRRLTTDGLLLSLLIVLAFAIAGIFTIDPLFRLLGADSDILPLIHRYMRIWYLGMPFVVIPMVGNNAIRATGDTKTPSLIMVLAILVNLSLDPLLIFGIGPFPRLELEGAAIATVIARATTLVVSLLVLSKREKMITLTRVKLQEVIASWKKILFIGLPAAGTMIIIPIATGIITRMISDYGVESVAGFGVASRIETFSITVISALATVIIPFIGQNLGAGRIDRIRLGLRFGQLFSMAWGGLLFIVFLFLARPLSRIFNDDIQVIEAASSYMLIVSVSYGAFGMFQLITASFNALNKPFHAAFLSILRVIVLYVPLAFLGRRLFGLRGMFGAATIANFLSALVAYLLLAAVLKKIKDPVLKRAL